MRITTTKTNVRDLLIILADADPNEEITFGKSKTKTLNTCWCGCGGTTGGRFQPGHDSKFHSLAKQVARDQAEHPTEFVNDEAKADFTNHVKKERPLHAAKVEKTKTEKAKKETTKTKKETTKTKKQAKPKKAKKAKKTKATPDTNIAPLDKNSEEYKLLLTEVQNKA